MAIIGFVDGMEGGYVIGWAANPPDTASCVITITDDDGHVLATGKAARRRPDLSVLGLGRVSLGFRIPVTCGAAPHRLHVRANGEDISDPPLKAGAGQYDAVCLIKEGRLTGWVTERCVNFEAPYIKAINQNGMIVAAGQASIDAGEIDPFFTPARFALDLADACFGAGEQLLVVYAGDVAVARLTCTLSLQGNLDELNATSCAGWLLSPEAPARVFTVQIFRDGKKSGEAICNVPRDDVRAIYPGCGKPGFGFTFPPPAPDPLSISMISLRLPGAVTDLFAGPYAVGSRAAAITAAQRASQLSYRLENLGPAERSVLQQALTEFITQARRGDKFLVPNQARDARPSRLAIIIPVYRGIEATQACIDSVLAHRDSAIHQLVIINDGSPEAEMAPMLASYYGEDNVALLNNPENLGFVQTVNRGLNFCIGADVLLLNADTILHAGGLAELQRAAYASPEIGTVTALSNNATIFSYPSIDLQTDALDDIGWAELAAAALKENAGLVVDVPTGHGFCLFIKAEVLRRVGRLDEAFGRGYGEENDFCARAASLGYRNVAAAAVIVEHRESISFAGERPSLIAQNMPRLNTLYPEYMPVVTEFERQDGMRRARWALDRLRLARAAAAGAKFSLVVSNGLDGGTKQAIADFERAANSKNVSVLRLRAQESGLLELSCESPAIAANFLPNETDDLLALLHAANPAHVQLHQLLGFPSHFIATMQDWAKTRHAIYFAHDFYAICPRVTMIDAIGRFCDVADTGTCARCIEMGGAHEASRLTELTPAAHRALFSGLLASMTHVVAPSANAAGYLQRAFPGLAVQAIPHPEQHAGIATTARAGNFDEILLLGAIGPHKGSDKLLEIARRARLTHPHLNFRIIGYTNMDEKLEKIGNVTITGKYSAETLPALINATEGKLALFLSTWPETYSYTLSEVVKYGFVPLVPNIGAPAERVRAAKFGAVFPFPIDAETVLNLLDAIAAGQIPTHAAGATPAAFMPTEADLARAATILFPQPAFSAPKKVKKSK
jgi:GT2 family glycosyltransferase/glycosyltransferase involved in cell wall biosynthesis